MNSIFNALLFLIFLTGSVQPSSLADKSPFSVRELLQDRNSITGFVFNEARAPLASISVELENEHYSTVARTRTNGSGLYSFTGLAPGRYVVKVVTSGTNFEEQRQSVSLVPLSVIQGRGIVTEQANFYLSVKRSVMLPSLGVPGVVYAQDVPPDAQKLYDSAISDLANNNTNGGVEKLRKALEVFPDFFMALDRLGTEYIVLGHYQPAYVLLKRALEVNPRSFTSTFGLGLAYYRLGHNKEGAEKFRDAVKLKADSVEAHLWLGIALHAEGKLDDALKSMRKANELSDKKSADVHWQLARLYKDQNRFKESADALELFLKYRPEAENAEQVRQIITTLRNKN